jgi:hypothetical protein
MLGPALVLAGGIVLEGASVASKELGGGGERALGVTLVALAAITGLAAVLRLAPGRERAWITSAALASLPAGAWLTARLADAPWAHVAAAATPLLFLGLAHFYADLARIGLALAALVLGVAAWTERPPPARADLPRADAPRASGPSVVLVVMTPLRADAVDQEARSRRARQSTSAIVSAAPGPCRRSGRCSGLVPSQHGASP